jgi:hypothetical protein
MIATHTGVMPREPLRFDLRREVRDASPVESTPLLQFELLASPGL